MHEAGLGEPVTVTVEDGGLGVCGFWVGVVGTAAAVAQLVVTFVH